MPVIFRPPGADVVAPVNRDRNSAVFISVAGSGPFGPIGCLLQAVENPLSNTPSANTSN
jgi:hypothetical protein